MSKNRKKDIDVNEEVVEDVLESADKNLFELSEEEAKALKIGKAVRKGLKGLAVFGGLIMAYSIGKKSGSIDDNDDGYEEDDNE